MKEFKLVFVLVAAIALMLVSVGQAAPTVIMDATLHNGSFTNGPVDYGVGYWYNTPTAIPTGWVQTSNHMYTTTALWVQTGTAGEAINNTGVLVQAGQAYTIKADLGGWVGNTAIVRVYATHDANGSGNKALLAQLTRAGTTADPDYSLFTVSNSGTGVSASLAGYYIQVKIGDSGAAYPGGFYDNIVVTSDVATSMTYMNADLHNGALASAAVDSTGLQYWYNTPSTIPYEWVETNLYMYTGASFIQTGTAGEAVNNTGELMQPGHAYTIQADLGGATGATAIVRVYATQNSNGTGAKALLAQLTRPGNSADGYNRFTVSSTGLGMPESLAGYYIQVKIGDSGAAYTGGFYDNIVVTSEVTTSMTYMNADLHNGALTAASINGWWSAGANYVATGWSMQANGGNIWQAATQCISVSGLAKAVNNTGEVVLGGHAFTVQADLGSSAIQSVRVYATLNADGSGDKALLAYVYGKGVGSGLTTFSKTSTAVPLSLDGYYVQVVVDGGGLYDNIVVTSVEATGTPTSKTYMDLVLHNGSLNASPGYWWDTLAAIPAGWVETSYYMYTAASLVQTGTAGQAVSNTGETVPASHKFTVKADLGGNTDCTARVQVYATQNSDGTGIKLLLAQVRRAGNVADGYNLFTVTGPVGAVTPPSVAGYYVQVVIGDSSGVSYPGGFYDNIVVTSELSAEAPTLTYMAADLHNGSMDSAYAGGFWWDDYFKSNDFRPYGWTSTDDPNVYTTSSRFIQFDSVVEAVTNNTGETVPVNHRFSIQADLGGFPGATAEAFVYATQNANGTGTKVLLAQVSRAGDANGLTPLYQRYTVAGTGLATEASVAGYYVQVLLKTAGDVNDNGHYDNIVVTSKDATPIPSKTYMDPNLHNGALTTTTAGDGYWTDPARIPFGGWSAAVPANAYTFSTMFVAVGPLAPEVINNTQETLVGNHRVKVKADLSGDTGATAQVFVYATKNWDGSGDKVLLAQVSRVGNDSQGSNLLTVSNTGSMVLPTLDGYYVQVVLKTAGSDSVNGYYDNITVTSTEPTCGNAAYPYPIGDLNKDCYVNFTDVQVFVSQWLESGCVTPGWCSGADLSQDGSVQFNDFAEMAAYWMNCTNPNPPCNFNP